MSTQIVEAQKAEPGRYLTFVLSSEIYAIPIRAVAEINGISDITHVPNTPHFVKGVINLRGKVIPVIDLRVKFGMEPVPYNRETCIIIAETWARQIGVIVDTVREVENLNRDQIESTPELGDADRTRFIMGMGKTENEVIILVDINTVLSPQEMGVLADATRQVAA